MLLSKSTAATVKQWLLTLAGSTAAVSGNIFYVFPDNDGSNLVQARDAVREEVARRTVLLTHRQSTSSASAEPLRFADIHVKLAPGTHTVPAGGLVLDSALDCGQPGSFQVVWTGSEDSESPTVISGGVAVAGWKPSKANSPSNVSFALWAAPAPEELLNGTGLTTRDLFVGGVRFNRTFVSGADVGVSAADFAAITESGYLTASTSPLSWTDPTSAEIVADFTWVQHRCPVVSVRNISTSLLGESSDPSACKWATKLPGTSPGSSLENLNVSTWEDCQAACCSVAACKGIIFHSVPAASPSCYLTDRFVEGNYIPGGGGFVADMNRTVSLLNNLDAR